MKNKIIISTLLALGISVSTVAFANASDKATNEDWDKPIFIQGKDLEGESLEKTKQELNVNSKYEKFFVNVNDVQKYVPNTGNLSYIHSSATIERKKFGKGVDVDIKTPDNITQVTTDQYRNVAITAGIENSNISIASIDPVTGEGALAGIYKVYSIKGDSLNQQDMENANKEIQDISQISKESKNQNQEGYSDEALNASIADIKQQLAEIRSKQDEQLTDEQVKDTVNEVLKDKGLSEILNDNQKNVITENMMNVASSNSLNANPEGFESQAKDLSKSIQKSAGDKLDKAKEFVNSDEGRSLGERIADSISKFIDSILNLINQIFSFLQNLFK